jgi:hypothetical protein
VGVSLPWTDYPFHGQHRYEHRRNRTAGLDPQVLADLDAVVKRISDGAAVDAETSRRIEERADRITTEIRRSRGVMDDDRFQALPHDDDDA